MKEKQLEAPLDSSKILGMGSNALQKPKPLQTIRSSEKVKWVWYTMPGRNETKTVSCYKLLDLLKKCDEYDIARCSFFKQ